MGSILDKITPRTSKTLQSGETPVTEAVLDDSIEALETILSKQNIDINATNIHGNSPLMCALLQGKLDAFELLMKHGASLDTLATKEVPICGNIIHYDNDGKFIDKFSQIWDTLYAKKSTTNEDEALSETFSKLLDKIKHKRYYRPNWNNEKLLRCALAQNLWSCRNHDRDFLSTEMCCFFSDQSSGIAYGSLKAKRLPYVELLLKKGVDITSTWNESLWRYGYYRHTQASREAIILCIRAFHPASNYIDTQSKLRSFFMNVGWSGDMCALLLIILSSYRPSYYDARDVAYKSKFGEHKERIESWLHSTLSQPLTLQRLCANSIRASFKVNVLAGVQALPIPDILRETVSLDWSQIVKELDADIVEEAKYLTSVFVK